VRVIEDAELMAVLADRGIVLEVNPGSNIALGVFDTWNDHPIDRLRAAGIGVTVSTDDPPYFHTNLTCEYAMLNKIFGWGRSDFDAQNRLALRAAFCDDATRNRLMPLFPETRP
jgi:adenosine deaminase